MTLHPTDAVVALLTAAGLDAMGHEPHTTPDGAYVVVYDDSGIRTPRRLSTAAHWATWTHQVMAVARTPEGLRHTMSRVVAALTGHRPPDDGTPLREVMAGPALEGGPEGDRRHTQTITFRHHTPRSLT